MIWTGEELYALYAQRTLELQSCGMDEWDQLDESTQAVWNALGVDVSNNE